MECPICESKDIEVNEKGWSFGNSLVGGVLFGAIGLVAGGINRKKKIYKCKNCNHTWS